MECPHRRRCHDASQNPSDEGAGQRSQYQTCLAVRPTKRRQAEEAFRCPSHHPGSPDGQQED